MQMSFHLTHCWLVFASLTLADEKGIDLKGNSWVTQTYLLPPDGTGLHSTGARLGDDLYRFGGLHLNAFYGIRDVFKLNIGSNTNPPSQSWQSVAQMNSAIFPQPWFPAMPGVLSVPSDPTALFITCEDGGTGDIYRFDTASNAFLVISRMPKPSEDCCAVTVNDAIYIFGGDDETTSTKYKDVQIYDVLTNTWSVGAEMPLKIQLNTCESAGTDIYLFGGVDDEFNFVQDVYKYSVVNNAWTTYANVIADGYGGGLWFAGAKYVPNSDYILLLGGEAPDSTSLRSVVAFNVVSNAIDAGLTAQLPLMNEARSGGVYAVRSEQQNANKDKVTVYAVGGRTVKNGEVFSQTTETLRFDVKY